MFNKKEVGSMKETVPFFKSVWLALNPWRYDELRDRGTWSTFAYFFSFVFLAFGIAVILMLPMIANFASTQMSHFNTLEVKFNTSMNSPVVFPQNDPFVTLDTRKSEGTLKEGRFLITDDYIYSKQFITGKVSREAVGQYKNLLSNDGIVIAILLLLAPSLLFLFYLLYALKVMLVVLVAALLGLIVTRVIKFDIPFIDTLKVALFASTPMIIIDLVRLPLSLNVYYAQYIAFIIFFIVGIVKAGDFDGMRPRKLGKHKGYIDLGKRI